MNSRPKQPKYARNKNVVVIGGSGSGKTRFFVKPNLMQLHSSYVLTDPKGTVLIECGKLLQRAGYRIKVLNTINFKKSMHYNPFVYIRSEKDILKLVNTLIANTKGEGEKSAEDFWVKAERLLYCALVGYIWYEAPAEEMNFITLLELINASEAREDDEEYQSPVDLLFADLEERDPDHFAVKQYRKYKLAAGKTAKSILISCGARLAPFDNGLILGTPGSGKSFSAKREITNAFLITADDIIICDPEAEYYPLVERLKGQVIKVSQNSTQYINPMDINLNYSEGDTPIALKSDFILSFCELIMGGKNGLEAVEKTLIDRAVISVYRSYLADPKPENMPILGDLYNEIKKQPEKEAQRIASALELYVNGSLNVFNHQTNVDIHNRLVCFDIKELGTQLRKLGMLIVQDQVWNRVTINRSEGKATRYYIDEFHLLLKEEQTAAYSVEIWKRFRKWGGIPTGITQNVKDLLSSREVENIFENSDFVYMLNQAQGDREILAKQLNISQQQMTYVTHSDAGEGLIFYGNVILPFIDRFPQDTELYRVMTTKPGEVSA